MWWSSVSPCSSYKLKQSVDLMRTEFLKKRNRDARLMQHKESLFLLFVLMPEE